MHALKFEKNQLGLYQGMTMSVFMVKVELNEPKNSIIVLYVTNALSSKRYQEKYWKPRKWQVIYRSS